MTWSKENKIKFLFSKNFQSQKGDFGIKVLKLYFDKACQVSFFFSKKSLHPRVHLHYPHCTKSGIILLVLFGMNNPKGFFCTVRIHAVLNFISQLKLQENL